MTTTKAPTTQTLTERDVVTLWNICLAAAETYKRAENAVKEWPQLSDQYAQQANEAKEWAKRFQHFPKVTIEAKT